MWFGNDVWHTFSGFILSRFSTDKILLLFWVPVTTNDVLGNNRCFEVNFLAFSKYHIGLSEAVICVIREITLFEILEAWNGT